MNESTLNESKIDEKVKIQLRVSKLNEEIIFNIIKLTIYNVLKRAKTEVKNETKASKELIQNRTRAKIQDRI